MLDEQVKKIKSSLLELGPSMFGKTHVLFAYLYGSYATGIVHPFSDLDIAVYVEKISKRQSLDLELSLALEIDEILDHIVASDVRILNNLPLMIAGKIITEGVLLFSKNDLRRVEFEISVRKAYFDFLPVLHGYQAAYVKRVAAD